MKERFSQREVNKIFKHIPPMTLRQWALDGLYQWVEELEDRRGIHRTFSLMNLYQLGVCRVLAEINMPIFRIQDAMKHFFVGENFQDEEIALKRMVEHILVIGINPGVKGIMRTVGTLSKTDFEKRSKKDFAGYTVLIQIDLGAIKRQVDTLIAQAV